MKTLCPLLSGLLALSQVSLAGTPWLDDLKSLVEINSGTPNQNGVLKVQKRIAAELTKLGFEVNLNEHQLLLAVLPGTSPKFINFIIHADTVFEERAKLSKFFSPHFEAVGATKL